MKLAASNRLDDMRYFARRASQERERAIVCEDNVAAIVHLKMAEEYERRTTGESARIAIVAE